METYQVGPISAIPKLIRELYHVVSALETLFPGRHFTLDGHLVGSIGEVLAAHYYELKLLPASAIGHDATTQDGVCVQIKATQKSKVGIRSEPQHLIVLGLTSAGANEEIFNGPGKLAWDAAGKMQKNGQRMISRSKLVGLMVKVKADERLPRVN